MAARENMILDASPAGLAGKRIGVESGGAHQAYVEDRYKDTEIHPYATLEEAILDLAEGRLDAVIGDKDALADFLKNRMEGQCCALSSDVPRDPGFFGDGVGIGLRKEDKTLQAMLDKALDESMADGAFARIRAKYFDFPINGEITPVPRSHVSNSK
jgi:polar amino acid transport system substrate-binding protein